jgi:hypothetical protein
MYQNSNEVKNGCTRSRVRIAYKYKAKAFNAVQWIRQTYLLVRNKDKPTGYILSLIFLPSWTFPESFI